MLSPLRNRFGIPGVISVVALVFAMLGGAYAASSNDNGKATASAKAKKGPRGPKGATGPTGPAGAQGPAGANGKDGSNGANGSNGVTGANGATGKSVAVSNYSGAECSGSEEGVSVEVAGEPSTKKYVCDGVEGAQGNEGKPWTPNSQLPSGATETGAWAFGNVPGTAIPSPASVPISFPIPLPSALSAAHVHYINAAGKELVLNFDTFELEELTPTLCGSGIGPGVNASNPQAEPGELCVYEGALFKATMYPNAGGIGPATKLYNFTNVGASTAGAVLRFGEIESQAEGAGTWAVTAP